MKIGFSEVDECKEEREDDEKTDIYSRKRGKKERLRREDIVREKDVRRKNIRENLRREDIIKKDIGKRRLIFTKCWRE